MSSTHQEELSAKTRWLFGIVIGLVIVAFLGSVLWWAWMFNFAELTAKCDNGFTIWRRNPGAFSSYIYEIRDGITLVETGLRTQYLKDLPEEYSCRFLGPEI